MGKGSRNTSSRSSFRERRDKRNQEENETTKMLKGFAKSCLRNFLIVLRMLVDFIVELVLEKYWGEKKVCPSLKKDFFITKSAIDIAKMIKNRELTSCQVVTAYIDRIKEVNSFINAVIDGPFMEAIDEAKKIDERIAKNQISDAEWAEKPFLGVPFTTKDSTAVGGKLHTLGITARKNIKAQEDAEIVRLSKNAGGIVIATSSVPEINRWQETRNNLIGTTNNPYDNRRTVGGSSGGEGALVTACCTAFGLGTDIGGSIRMPSYYCGIFGHKPSPNTINIKGCTLRSGKDLNTMVSAGPMVRYARDLKPLLEILVSPKVAANTLGLNQKVQVQKLRYFYCLENCDIKCSKICGDLCNSMAKITDHFQNLTGEQVQLVSFKGTRFSSKLWRYWMTQEPQSFNELLGNTKKLNPFIELAKKLTGTSEYTLASVFSLIDSVLPEEDAIKMRSITKQLSEEIDELLGDDGVLFYPSTTHVAPYHCQAFIQIYNFAYWSIFNVLQLPVTQVPLGLNKDGLPLGVQVVATKNRDRHTIAVAEELEREFKGWVPPFKIDN